MPRQQNYPPPRRKEPGPIGRLLSSITQFVVWLLVSLILSILMEWVGMAYFWPEEKSEHAKAVLEADKSYLNHHISAQTNAFKHKIATKAHLLTQWLEKALKPSKSTKQNNFSLKGLQRWSSNLKSRYYDHILAAGYVSQTFIIRVTLILFSLPVFLLAGLVGTVDGLVERDLRRWGGGRESSNVFNLAKRSVMPAFVAACVIYIGLPLSLNPALIILPFACLYGLTVRITFERLKKYF
ncbi:TIGR03747 family integrating conjugative element membrane protein [Porticoccus sp. GXU_MW_L64]